ncbi:MAG: SDR family oxidoreductase [Candidatus Dormibacteraeota bacterium]|uniref:SDR family oxidoreductase n=1 Tax=Candidatus Dormiibacter inghamiae TaxID=3127013 RepID=A0A934KGD1_9BACT|nr:SDR family oxidoreductase [Candidatus Dormibacteraeota bacterium]MBJ7606357.1 SDR family oxidoreductase [Candidatus Dormibacteraeota bacterium]
MKLAVFGGTGFAGSAVVDEALARGHEVRMLARDPSRVEATGERLTVVPGDVRDSAAVAATVEGCDAVISTLGPRRGEKQGADFLAEAMRNILHAMEEHGVRRIVAISGAGITLPGDHKPIVHVLAGGVVNLLARSLVTAKRREYEVLSASPVGWTAVRPTRIVEGPATERRQVSLDGSNMGMRATRGDVAALMVDEATSPGHHRQAPFVSS